jgi:hypothetical protein
MGNADAYTKAHKNLHSITRPLRAALYARLGVNGSGINEVMPVWREPVGDQVGLAEFESSLVKPDNRLDGLLDDIQAMFTWIQDHFPTAAIKNQRKHSSAMLAAEICHAANPERDTISLYETIFKIPKGRPLAAAPSWAALQPCSGRLRSGAETNRSWRNSKDTSQMPSQQARSSSASSWRNNKEQSRMPLQPKPSCPTQGYCFPSEVSHAKNVAKGPLCASCSWC